MSILFKFLSATPTYVYFILIYLLFVGIRASKDRIVSWRKLMLAYTLLIYLSSSALAKLKLSYLHGGFFFALTFVFVVISWFFFRRQPMRIDRQKKLIALPGSWSTLCLVLIIFSLKYYLGFALYRGYRGPQTHYIVLCTSAFSLGVILGRGSSVLFRGWKLQHTDLSS